MNGNAVIRVFHDSAEARQFVLGDRRLESTELPPAIRQSVRRVFGADLSASQVVDRILDDVHRLGDEALTRYSAEIDGADLENFEVSRDEIDRALDLVPADVLDALRVSRDRIEMFHRRQLRNSWVHIDETGTLGQILRPLERVGVYAPGGRAPYPSSLLMSAVPALVAGVPEIVACTPPNRDGSVSPLILAAAKIAGIERVFALGGAQAIGAMAYGTESVPRVDKIVGPGNIFVVLAKKRVFGDVDIDQLPGPTETLLIADESARADLCAADLLAQAEHDPLASAILLTNCKKLAEEVEEQLAEQIPSLERSEIIRDSLLTNGAIAVVPDLDTAFDIANDYAPEHLCLLVDDGWSKLDKIKNAGGVFVGESSPEVLGDYTAGPSHVMPTGQTARFSSPLNVEEFIKVISVVGLNETGLSRLGPAASVVARAEGLTAHARAVERRLERRRPAGI